MKRSDCALGKSYPRVVVVDDDRMIRTVLKHRLAKVGYEVATAENGVEALELITPDTGVVLLDLHMPEMDGIECLRRIRAMYQELTPIMITASEDISDAVEAMKYGAFDYLVKPVDSNKLLGLVEKAIENWRQACQLKQVKAELERARARENNIAAKIQQTLLMGQVPANLEGIRISQLTIPSQSVDGDFFDFIKLNDRSLDIVVGDVMGKGVASALLGAAMKSHFLRVVNGLLLEDRSDRPPDPSEIVTRIHANMIRRLEEIETYVTLCYARIDLTRSEFVFVDCGHVRTIQYHAKNGVISLLEGVNVPLGLPESEAFQQISVPFETGDIFFFYSDGLTEAQNPDGEMYGEERLVDFILGTAPTAPEYLIQMTHDEMIHFTQSSSFEDDFTCVAVAITE